SLTKTSKSFLDPDLLSEQVKRVEKLMIKIFGCGKEVKSFLRGIGRYNNSKYNTEKCMIDFYKKLPVKVVGGWRLKQEAIGSICKLRNDISHANDYFETSDDLLAKCAFVESLLIISLLETVGLPISISSGLIFRLPGAHNLNEQ
ncbi:HEPN domain-containing protein, partial [Pseudomonas gingeri]